MLVLARKEKQSVYLIVKGLDGEEIVIQVCVVEAAGDQVRLGFDAPREVDIEREEIFKARSEKPAK